MTVSTEADGRLRRKVGRGIKPTEVILNWVLEQAVEGDKGYDYGNHAALRGGSMPGR
ncbi:MAG: hypothetical protein JRN09_05155 [Nitrososphaerota archaeon]|nr:hypothetical protein [Nitrososphaerota archaeon]